MSKEAFPRSMLAGLSASTSKAGMDLTAPGAERAVRLLIDVSKAEQDAKDRRVRRALVGAVVCAQLLLVAAVATYAVVAPQLEALASIPPILLGANLLIRTLSPPKDRRPGRKPVDETPAG